MLDIQLSNILIALAVTTGAGLATGIGGLLVFTTRAPNARLLAFGLAFAGGAMVFVSLSEILNKSIQSFSLAYGDNLGFTCAILAFLTGLTACFEICLLAHEVNDCIDRYPAQQFPFGGDDRGGYQIVPFKCMSGLFSLIVWKKFDRVARHDLYHSGFRVTYQQLVQQQDSLQLFGAIDHEQLVSMIRQFTKPA